MYTSYGVGMYVELQTATNWTWAYSVRSLPKATFRSLVNRAVIAATRVFGRLAAGGRRRSG